MYNRIILSSCLFGSVYLFSKSLQLINRQLLEGKKIPRSLLIMNGIILMTSGAIFMCNSLWFTPSHV
jgi:hypothetical protein